MKTRSHQCTHPGRTSALHNVLKHPKTYNPSLPTGEPPASGGRPSEGNADTKDAKGEDSGIRDARDVIDRLTAMRSGLSLTTAEPTARDLARVEALIARVAGANGNGRTVAKGLILGVIDWMPSNTWWLGRIDTARRLADNWDKLRNEWVIAIALNQADENAAPRSGTAKQDDGPTPCPPVYHPKPHRHNLRCEHVLADMKPHEDEYDHEGSLRYGNPSEWQRACMARADELNRRDGDGSAIYREARG